ncbi:4-alpha-glucanotransferase [Cytophaga aurantiaca]|uniref:4-alpha-glucanotransferase n=1 Tax=Cytophaga aurantiaca TaxID=29530 RepID=UPI0003755154|nr:4-alpha-glucanotransferase [Cytophaga aurantiaca]
MKINRSCGALLHISSLYNSSGIGDFGPSAYSFADYLSNCGMTYWQTLPLNYTDGGRGFSPYSCLSAFAGNPLFISPEILLKEDLLLPEDITNPIFEEHHVEFDKAYAYKMGLLTKAFERFEKKDASEFNTFCSEHAYWLDDFTLFLSIKNFHGGAWWLEWPKELKNREASAITKIKKTLEHDIKKQKFIQYQFFKQLNTLKNYCNYKNIKFIGDMPFYVSHDSSDVWKHREYFKLSKDGSPAKVAGVPPDMFSETGQLWGMPVFNWSALQKTQYDWWVKRVKHTLLMCDIIRLDHFRAFSAYYEIPASEHTAVNGKWTKTPGNSFFNTLKKMLNDLPFIAEDLGEIDQPVIDLIEKFRLPGMKLLQFAFSEHTATSIHSPHNYKQNNVVYTGTHDNNTLLGWYTEEISDETRQNISTYLNKEINHSNVNKEFIRKAISSVAVLAILPVQDLLNLGSEAKMNRPGSLHGNWQWRLHSQAPFTEELAKEIRNELTLFNRI